MKIKILILSLLLLVSNIFGQSSVGFTKIANTANLTYIDTTCPNLSTCYYQITALDSTNHESQAALCSSTQLCFATNQAVAQMPSSGTHTVTINWTASTTSGVTYNVYQHIGPLPPNSLSTIVN